MARAVSAGFHNPVRIRFGKGSLSELGALLAGRRAILLTSEGMEKRGTLHAVEAAMGAAPAARFSGIAPNPTIAACRAAAEMVAGAEADAVVAVGGGSVLDTAKTVAAQRAAPAGWLSAHLREGVPFPAGFRPLPILAVPTTAGTGSEVTMWGTVWDEKTGKKYSLSHPALYPEAALLDPTLTVSLPASITTATALDALSHSMEAVWNRASNPVSDALALRAISLIPAALRRALGTPTDLAARETLLEAALLAGLASSGTRTALAHSISYPLTSELGVAHGLACSITLPEILAEVGVRHPERASLLARALGAPSVEGARGMLYDLYRAAGVPAALARHVPDAERLSGLRTGFIAPGRAENCLIPADQASASLLLRRAFDALLRDA